MSNVKQFKSPDGVDELIREIQIKHGLLLTKSDPILMVFTILAEQAEGQGRKQEELLKQFSERLELQLTSWTNTTREKSEAIINASLDVCAEMLNEQLLNANKELQKVISQAVASALQNASPAIQQAGTHAKMNFIASLITLISATIVLFTVIFFSR